MVAGAPENIPGRLTLAGTLFIGGICPFFARSTQLPENPLVFDRSGEPWDLQSIHAQEDCLQEYFYGIYFIDFFYSLAHRRQILPEMDQICLCRAACIPREIIRLGFLLSSQQHAADERIRLEELRQNVLSGKGKSISYLEYGKELVLPEFGFQLLQNYTDQIQRWGWLCDHHAENMCSFTRNLNLLHPQAVSITLIAVPCILGINLSDKDLLEFLDQLADTDGTSSIPPAVLRILNYKACRGAIMFGDTLLPSECSLIVNELKRTSLCFQCAHGRPTTVPLVNLEALHEQLNRLNSSGSGATESWHGLRRYAPSLDRAKARLAAARNRG